MSASEQLDWMSRDAKVKLLESVGFAVTDDEPEWDLDHAILNCIETGDLNEGDLE